VSFQHSTGKVGNGDDSDIALSTHFGMTSNVGLSLVNTRAKDKDDYEQEIAMKTNAMPRLKLARKR
jgi:hypothetical protein